MAVNGEKYYAVALDGPSGAGKSTIARGVARELGFVYVDTGALYRTVAYGAWQRGIASKDGPAIAALLPELKVTMDYGEDGLQRMYLNGTDVTKEIRLPEVSSYASDVSAVPEVREFLFHMQRDMAKKGNVIMDGRDIGTVILPNADVKIFLTASAEERARRRFRDLKKQDTPEDYGIILMKIEERDYNDSHRAVAPLRRADDAIPLDTSGLSFDEARDAVLKIIREKLGI